MARTPEEEAELQALKAEMVELEPVIRQAQGAAISQEMQTRKKMFDKPPVNQRWKEDGTLEYIPGAKKTEAQQRMSLLGPETKQEMAQVEEMLV